MIAARDATEEVKDSLSQSRKTVLMNPSTGQSRDSDTEIRTMDTAGEGEGGTNSESGIEICVLSWINRSLTGSFCTTQGARPDAL